MQPNLQPLGIVGGDEQQRPVNEVTIGNTARVPKDVALPTRAVFLLLLRYQAFTVHHH